MLSFMLFVLVTFVLALGVIKARGAIEHHALQSGLDLYMPAAVPKLPKTPGKTRWLGPELGAHNHEVLEGLGLDADMIKKVSGGL